MDEYYFSADLVDNRRLRLAPLTDRHIAMCGDEIEDPSGYYLFEIHGTGSTERVEVLARVMNEDAVFWLQNTFNMR